MSRCTQILVSLRHADPTALTALGCLRRSLGYGTRLADLRRMTLWELTTPQREDPQERIPALRRSGELWNPNKEAASVRLPGRPAAELRFLGRDGEGWDFFLAWNPERDLDRTILVLAGLRDRGWRVARGVVWGLCWSGGSSEERMRWSEEAVVCRGPRQGLLVHPHLEDCRPIRTDQAPPWLPVPGVVDGPRREAG